MIHFRTPLRTSQPVHRGEAVDCVATRRAGGRQGAMLILIAVMLFMFLITVAFSIDVAQMHLSRAELRTASDAAANAAAITLADTLDQSSAIARGQQIAAANRVNGEPLLLAADDFDFGRSERSSSGKYRFHEGGSPLNGVRVNGRRTVGSRSGAVPLLFGNVTGTHIFEPSMTATATYIERDITLVIDRSGSMQGQMFTDLRTAIAIFTNLLSSTPVKGQVGLASYNDLATEDVQLTEDFSQINAAMAELRASGYTSISGGMEAGRNIAVRGRSAKYVERTMIVMTDGQHNRGIEPRVIAHLLAADNITIHTITFGHDADVVRMKEVAMIGGGRHYDALTGAELQQVYREIALTLGTVLTD